MRHSTSAKSPSAQTRPCEVSNVSSPALSSIENKNADAYYIVVKTGYRMRGTFCADKNLDGVIDGKGEEIKHDSTTSR